MNVGSASSLVTKVDTVPEDQRVAAAHRIAHRRQQAFKIYAGVLAAVNALIVAFWVVLAIIGRLDLVHISVWPGQPPLPDWFFWPVIPIAICSYLVFMSARRAYPRDGYSDEVLMQEIARHPATRVALGEHEAASAPGNTPRPAPRDLNRAQVPRAAGVESTLAVRRRGFAVRVVVYVVINAVLVAAWALGGGGFFWPVFLMSVWGVGVLVNAYQAYRPHP
jgi:hypothetical protein